MQRAEEQNPGYTLDIHTLAERRAEDERWGEQAKRTDAQVLAEDGVSYPIPGEKPFVDRRGGRGPWAINGKTVMRYPVYAWSRDAHHGCSQCLPLQQTACDDCRAQIQACSGSEECRRCPDSECGRLGARLRELAPEYNTYIPTPFHVGECKSEALAQCRDEHECHTWSGRADPA